MGTIQSGFAVDMEWETPLTFDQFVRMYILHEEDVLMAMDRNFEDAQNIINEDKSYTAAFDHNFAIIDILPVLELDDLDFI